MKKETKKQKKQSNISIFINKIMPYVLAVFFAIMIFSLLGFAGAMGEGIKYAFYGVFSNFGTIVLTILLLYHAIMWYYDTKRKICFRRVFCSVLAVLCISTLQHLIECVGKNQHLREVGASEHFTNGTQTLGGGFVGGLIGNLLLKLGNIMPFIIVLFIFTFMLLQMFNITPASMVRAIGSKNREHKEEAKPVKKQKRPKPKYRKVDIFDDDDDDIFSEENIADLAITETTVTTIKDNDEQEYQSARTVMSSARPIESSSQLKPFDESRDYSASTSDDEKEDDLIVTTERLANNEPQPTYTSTTVSTFELSSDDEQDSEEQESRYEPIIPIISDTKEENELDYTEPELDEEYTSTYEIESEEEYTHFEQDSYDEQDDLDALDEDEELEDDEDYEDEDINIDFDEDEPDELEPPTQEPVIERAPVVAPRPEPKPEPKPEPPKPKKKIKYIYPPIDLLKYVPESKDEEAIRQELAEKGDIIVGTLANFGVRTKIVDIARGPTVTRYEIAPEAGVRVKSIANLVDDIALNLAAEGIRIECPIPGKSAVGIEVPNKTLTTVYLKELIANKKFKEAKSVLTCALGKSISGDVEYVDIEKTPHLLVAGATSMGKSVCINSMLISMLYKSNPNEVRLILIDPKRVEFSDFNGLPHLLVPVVTEPKKSLGALQWSVAEMERRFELFEPTGARNLAEFNEKVDNGYESEKLSRIVIVIDELADLKMTVPDIEGYITRLTQKARAAGIHIIIGTQRPSVDVITGLIKSNIPSRISFRVASQVDSRTILDEVGAEKLVHRGDMLVKIVGSLRPVRLQGSLVTASEVQDVINFIKENSTENYDESVMQQIDSNAAKLAKADKKESDADDEGGSGSGEDFDEKFYAALKLAVDQGKISSSMLMRKLGLGFQRASRIIDQMEECGYISEANGSKPRDVLISKEDYLEMMMRREDTEE